MNIIEPLKPLINYVINTLTEIRDVTLLSIYIGLPTTLFTGIINWISSPENIDYVRIVLTAIAIDHSLGTLAHSRWFRNDFSILKNIGGLGIKILVVTTMGSLFNDLATLAITEDFVYKYLLFVTRMIIFFYPARSAMRNCFIVTRGAFPPEVFMRKSDAAFNNMDFSVFKRKQENEDNNPEN